jgi:phage baseplate assembly protein W
MPDYTTLNDVDHFFGQDVAAGNTGDLALVQRLARSRQRVLRRLLTNPGDYEAHPEYGAGIPRMIGESVDLKRIEGVIRAQLLLESSVQITPAPTIRVSQITGGVSVVVNYVALPDKQPVSLSFNMEA